MKPINQFRWFLLQYIVKSVLHIVLTRPAGFILTAGFYGYAYYLQQTRVDQWWGAAPFETAQTLAVWMWGTHLLSLAYRVWTEPLMTHRHVLLKQFFNTFPPAVLQSNRYIEVHKVSPAYLHRAASTLY